MKAVTKAVGALPDIGGVTAGLIAGNITVEYDASQCTLNKIKAEIDDQGCDIAE